MVGGAFVMPMTLIKTPLGNGLSGKRARPRNNFSRLV
jgi:hypothetical protein